STNTPGRVDIVLPLKRHLVVTEWKAVRIDYLDIRDTKRSTSGFLSREVKASILSTYTLDNILGLKFGKNDKDRYDMTLKQWIEEDVTPQLKDCMTSTEMKKKLEDQ